EEDLIGKENTDSILRRVALDMAVGSVNAQIKASEKDVTKESGSQASKTALVDQLVRIVQNTNGNKGFRIRAIETLTAFQYSNVGKIADLLKNANENEDVAKAVN